MKRILIAVLWAVCAFSAQAITRENVRIMTFNIPYGNVNTETNTWEKRVEKLTEYFQTISPDLIGMQEPVRAEMVDLLAGMPGYSMLGVARNYGTEEGEYSCILYKNSRFKVEANGTYWVSNTPTVRSKVDGSTHYRIATWALLTDVKTGAQFLYTNTHLSYDSEACRYAQIQILKTQMYNLNQKYGTSLPHLLTGDFNMHSTETNNYNYIKNYMLIMNDMYVRAATKTGGSVGSFIDFIYGTKNIGATHAQTDSRYTSDGYTMSDHNPLWADVYWTTTNAENAYAAIQESLAAIDSTYTRAYTRTKLITAANQLSADELESSYSNLSNVLDANTTTFIHSKYSSLAKNQPHYLQAKLSKAISNFRFNYCRREGDDGLKDCWQDVMIQASSDGSTWDYITTLNDFCGCDGKTAVKYYASDNISLHKPYSYIRFNVMHTPGEVLRNSNPEFSLSELQLYENTISDTSERYTDSYVGQACDSLEALITATEEKITAGTVTSADVTALRTALQVLRDTRNGGSTGISRIENGKMEMGNAAVYNLAGQCVSVPAGSTTRLPKGVNIIRKADGTVYKVLQ